MRKAELGTASMGRGLFFVSRIFFFAFEAILPSFGSCIQS